jgi:uncharacterized protein (TIGR02145 family)
MKKLVYIVTILGLSFSCKKEATNDNSNNTSSVACIDNPNINFKSIGTPVGKFSDCIKDIDGNTYKTVTIGSQTWMAENLKTSKYNDGTTIPNSKVNSDWAKINIGSWCYFKNDSSFNSNYGKLYNGYVIISSMNGNKNVCPIDWHVPSYEEWIVLIDNLGGSDVAGGKMKAIDQTWGTLNIDANNISLFTGLPGGFRDSISRFSGEGSYGYWWSSTNFNFNLTKRINLYGFDGKIHWANSQNTKGFSIRCLKD